MPDRNDEMRITLLRSARVRGKMRTAGWSGQVALREALSLIDRGWAMSADRTRGRAASRKKGEGELGDAGGKRR